jgi:hypothetical protein
MKKSGMNDRLLAARVAAGAHGVRPPMDQEQRATVPIVWATRQYSALSIGVLERSERDILKSGIGHQKSVIGKRR